MSVITAITTHVAMRARNSLERVGAESKSAEYVMSGIHKVSVQSEWRG